MQVECTSDATRDSKRFKADYGSCDSRSGGTGGGDAAGFRLTFTNPQGLKQLTEIVGNILTECHFQVHTGKNGGFEGIVVESIDSKMVCMITARLACRAEGKDGVFCVKMSTLNTLLRSVQPHYCLDVTRVEGSPEVDIHAYETSSTACRSRFSMRTLAKEMHDVKLDDIDYEYTVEIDLTTLRQIVKMARDLKASVMRFTVEEPVKEQDARHTYLKVSADGDDADMLHCFHSVTEWEEQDSGNDGGSGNVVIRTADDAEAGTSGGELAMKYSERFSTDYLSYFLKSMERHPLTMRLSSNKPLILHYPLGSNESSICFVLAPKADSSA